MELYIIFFIIGFASALLITKNKHKEGNLLLAKDEDGIYAFMELNTDMEKVWNSNNITLKVIHKTSADEETQE